MLGNLDIEKWLVEHSIKMTRNDKEIIFDHPNGNKSILLLYTERALQNLDQFPPLAAFYSKYAGGFIGNGYLFIGTPLDESISTSVGKVVPSTQEIRTVSEGQGMVFLSNEMPFMTSGYMFVYTFSTDGKLRCHDRDFNVVTEDETVSQLLEGWWSMEQGDQDI